MKKLGVRAGLSKEFVVLLVDGLLSAVILLPVLLVVLSVYSLEASIAVYIIRAASSVLGLMQCVRP